MSGHPEHCYIRVQHRVPGVVNPEPPAVGGCGGLGSGGRMPYGDENRRKPAFGERKDAGDKDEPLIERNALLKDRWCVIYQLGGGGFGQIYVAKDIYTHEKVAVKAEAIDAKIKFIHMEYSAIKKLQGRPHIAVYYGSGAQPRYHYIVMTLLGRNLAELKKSTPHDRFSLATAGRLGYYMLRSIQNVHEAGLLHRDIKPTNFAMGLTDSGMDRTLFILDFGLCRNYLNKRGELRPPRVKCGFRGTVRYASINCHHGRDMGRHDDIWSLFYVILEMFHGQLPWRKVTDRHKCLEVKKVTPVDTLLRGLPAEVTDFYLLLEPLDFHSIPPYENMARCFVNLLERFCVRSSMPYDWETVTHLNDVNFHRNRAVLQSGGPTLATGDHGQDDTLAENTLPKDEKEEQKCPQVPKVGDMGAHQPPGGAASPFGAKPAVQEREKGGCDRPQRRAAKPAIPTAKPKEAEPKPAQLQSDRPAATARENQQPITQEIGAKSEDVPRIRVTVMHSIGS